MISLADAPNARSIAVMRRIGMCFDHAPQLSDENGVFDAVVYSMDAARYQEHPKDGMTISRAKWL